MRWTKSPNGKIFFKKDTRNWKTLQKCLQNLSENNFQFRILYLMSLSTKCEGRIKAFIDKQKILSFSSGCYQRMCTTKNTIVKQEGGRNGIQKTMDSTYQKDLQQQRKTKRKTTGRETALGVDLKNLSKNMNVKEHFMILDIFR